MPEKLVLLSQESRAMLSVCQLYCDLFMILTVFVTNFLGGTTDYVDAINGVADWETGGSTGRRPSPSGRWAAAAIAGDAERTMRTQQMLGLQIHSG